MAGAAPPPPPLRARAAPAPGARGRRCAAAAAPAPAAPPLRPLSAGRVAIAEQKRLSWCGLASERIWCVPGEKRPRSRLAEPQLGLLKVWCATPTAQRARTAAATPLALAHAVPSCAAARTNACGGVGCTRAAAGCRRPPPHKCLWRSTLVAPARGRGLPQGACVSVACLAGRRTRHAGCAGAAPPATTPRCVRCAPLRALDCGLHSSLGAPATPSGSYVEPSSPLLYLPSQTSCGRATRSTPPRRQWGRPQSRAAAW